MCLCGHWFMKNWLELIHICALVLLPGQDRNWFSNWLLQKVNLLQGGFWEWILQREEKWTSICINQRTIDIDIVPLKVESGSWHQGAKLGKCLTPEIPIYFVEISGLECQEASIFQSENLMLGIIICDA